jgi:hypothetical protein
LELAQTMAFERPRQGKMPLDMMKVTSWAELRRQQAPSRGQQLQSGLPAEHLNTVHLLFTRSSFRGFFGSLARQKATDHSSDRVSVQH